MLYQGSKARIGKHIAPIIEFYRGSKGTVTEPFCGGLNMTAHLGGVKYCSDSNKYLIAMWEELLYNNWDPPKEWDAEHYEHVRDNKDLYSPHYVGWIGFCTFGGGFFNGFRNPDKKRISYPREYRDNILQQKQQLFNVILSCHDYKQVIIRPSTVVYCDPPYASTKGYQSYINHWHFWSWCKEISKQVPVLVSEYSCPLPDFKLVWLQSRNSTLRLGEASAHIEKLYVHESHFVKRFL